jgi:hypothetical protein
VILAPLGAGADEALHLVVFASFAGFALACAALGRALVSWPVGVLFAAIVVTREPLVRALLDTSFDVVFLALVVLAGLLEARGSPSRAVAAALVAAGLLRPEGWLLVAAYALLQVARRGGRAWRWALVAAAAPLAWAAFDLAVTGDPLHSLVHTRELASALERPRSVGGAPELLGAYLVAVLREPVAWGGGLSALASLWLLPGRLALPLGLLGLGVLAFLALGVAGLPLLTRYALVPALMLALLCAVGVLGAREVDAAGVRRAWALAGAALAVLLLAFVPSDVDRLRVAVADADARRGLQHDLEAIASTPALAACAALSVPGPRALPVLARGGRDVAVERLPARSRGATIRPATPEAAAYALLAPDPGGRVPLPAPGGRELARNASWHATGDCPGRRDPGAGARQRRAARSVIAPDERSPALPAGVKRTTTLTRARRMRRSSARPARVVRTRTNAD